MRDNAGRSLPDREAGGPSDTRQLVESDRRKPEEKAMPYVVAVAILFVLAVIVIMMTR